MVSLEASVSCLCPRGKRPLLGVDTGPFLWSSPCLHLLCEVHGKGPGSELCSPWVWNPRLSHTDTLAHVGLYRCAKILADTLPLVWCGLVFPGPDTEQTVLVSLFLFGGSGRSLEIKLRDCLVTLFADGSRKVILWFIWLLLVIMGMMFLQISVS